MRARTCVRVRAGGCARACAYVKARALVWVGGKLASGRCGGARWRARARACTHTPARAMARAGCVSNLLRAAEAAPPRHQRVRGDRRVCAYTCTNSCTRERVPPFVRRRPPAVTAGGLPPPAAGRSRAHPDPPAQANTSRLRGQVQSMRSQSADEYRLRGTFS